MTPGSEMFSRGRVLLYATGALLIALALLARSTESGAQQQSNFMGGNPEFLSSDDLSMLRLRFPAGVRSNWHTHTDGQLLMLESGRGLTQVRGEPIHEMRPGEPWWTDAGVEHWHGAHPEEASVQLTIYAGTVNWMEPVMDDAYNAPAQRP